MLAGVLVSLVVMVVGFAAVAYGVVGHGNSLSSAKLPLDPIGLQAVGVKEINSEFMDSKIAQDDVEKLTKAPPEVNAILNKDGSLEKLMTAVSQMHALEQRLHEGDYSKNATLNRDMDLLMLMDLANESEALVDDEEKLLHDALTKNSGGEEQRKLLADYFGQVLGRVPNPVTVASDGVTLTLKDVKSGTRTLVTKTATVLKREAKATIGQVCAKGLKFITSKGKSFCRKMALQVASYCELVGGGPEDPVSDVCTVTLTYAVNKKCNQEVTSGSRWAFGKCKAAGDAEFEQVWNAFMNGHRTKCNDFQPNFVCPGAGWASNCRDRGSRAVCTNPHWKACWRLHCKQTCNSCHG